MKLNLFYLLVIVLGAALFLITPTYFKGSSDAIPAVTYAKNHKLSAEVPAKVKKVWVKPGQQINPGDTLIELLSESIIQELEKANLKLTSIHSDQQAQNRSMRSALNLAKSEIQLEVATLENDIRMAENELMLNRRLAAGPSKISGLSPLEIRIQDLKEQVNIRKAELTHREDEIKNRYSLQLNQFKNQEILLKTEIEMLKSQQIGLIKISDFKGVVETVYVKSGEVVEDFTDLISLLPSSPTSVVGYLSTGHLAPEIGSPIQIVSMTATHYPIQGKVIGHGSIVPLPEILQKATAVKAFGREIFLEIPSDNPFSTGEKVMVKR